MYTNNCTKEFWTVLLAGKGIVCQFFAKKNTSKFHSLFDRVSKFYFPSLLSFLLIKYVEVVSLECTNSYPYLLIKFKTSIIELNCAGNPVESITSVFLFFSGWPYSISILIFWERRTGLSTMRIYSEFA